MKVIELKAENFKRLSAVDITPRGHVIPVSGKNAQGKSSVLDAIWAALQPSDAKIGVPLRKGAESGRVRLMLGTEKAELIVERKYRDGGSTVSVKSADGKSTFNSPQKMLDALVGHLSFDPLSFARKNAKEQFDELRKVVQLDIDFTAIKSLNDQDFSRRTDVNRQAKAKRSQAEAITVLADLPEAPLDEEKLLNDLQSAGNVNTDIEVRRANRERAAEQIDQHKANAQAKRDHAAELRRQADLEDEAANVEDSRADALQEKLNEAGPLPEPVDVTELRKQLDAARTTNAAIANRARRRALEAEADSLEAEAEVLTKAMDDRNAGVAKAISEAKMPVEGLGLGEDVVTFNGVPFAQASMAEKLKVSMALAMAANPQLRVIRITDGSLLDDDSMAVIGEMARDKDFQVWVERVSNDRSVGIVIEDGAVAVVNEAPATEATA